LRIGIHRVRPFVDGEVNDSHSDASDRRRPAELRLD
jgi:hypothetical protein